MRASYSRWSVLAALAMGVLVTTAGLAPPVASASSQGDGEVTTLQSPVCLSDATLSNATMQAYEQRANGLHPADATVGASTESDGSDETFRISTARISASELCLSVVRVGDDVAVSVQSTDASLRDTTIALPGNVLRFERTTADSMTVHITVESALKLAPQLPVSIVRGENGVRILPPGSDDDDSPTDGVNDTIDNTTDDTTDTIDNTTDDTTDTVDNTTDDTTDTVDNTTDTIDNTTDTVDNTTDDTTDTVDDTTNDSLDDTTDTVDETVDETTDTVDETVDETTDTVDDTVNETTDTVDDTVNETTDTIDNTTDDTTDTVDDTGNGSDDDGLLDDSGNETDGDSDGSTDDGGSDDDGSDGDDDLLDVYDGTLEAPTRSS